MNSVLARLAPASWPTSVRLLLISFLSLYFELMLIRWLPTEIRILAYFNNIVLISCILGLGIGVLLADRTRRIRPTHFFWLLALLIILADVYHGRNIHLPLASEGHFIWNGLSKTATGTVVQYIAMFVFFAVNMAAFVPIGQLLGKEFDKLPPIRAYSWNILGALLGMIAFALFSRFGVDPMWWFVAGVILFIPLLPRTLPLLGSAALVVALVVFGSFEENTYWSPYYKITTERIALDGQTIAVKVRVNDDGHQTALDLSTAADRPDNRASRAVYDEPYRYGSNDEVLIVGAGTGNDVAAALRAGAKNVDAVEIDPVILRLGEEIHPERPYSDTRVTLTNRDARTYIRNSSKKYDKVVLGYLDSHSMFSAMSSVRLDNFVYTREFFQEMKEHLKPDGMLAVTFTVHEAWIADRLYTLFTETFGYSPLVFQGSSRATGTVYLAGNPIRTLSPTYIEFDPSQGGSRWVYGANAQGYVSPEYFNEASVVPTDNWPYLYMRDAAIPTNYIVCMAVLFFLSFFAIRTTTGLGKVSWHFFFLGAAFLLVETKAITELAIFLGSTWVVNFFVISAILALILLANLIVARGWAPRTHFCYLALGITLVVTLFLPLDALLSWESALRDWVAVAVLCLPLFFAGLIFAQQLKVVPQPSVALGSNLLGALAGGMLEYTAMIYGLKSLYVFALVLYGLSYVLLLKPKSADVPGAASAET